MILQPSWLSIRYVKVKHFETYMSDLGEWKLE